MIIISNEETGMFSGYSIINRRRSDKISINAGITGVRMFKIRLVIFKYIMIIAAGVIGSNILVSINE